MLHDSLGQLVSFASIPSKPCTRTSQRLLETPMIIKPDHSLVVCFSKLPVQDLKVIPYKNANSLYYFPYRGNYLTKSFDGILL